jgi:hypothetical protein
VLLPAGIVGAQRAYRTDRRYVPVCALPLLFGIQQLLEGMVWTAGARQDDSLIEIFSLAYMFFAWLAWPVGIPVSAYFVEPDRRKPLYLGFAIAGAILGAAQYFPYLAHKGWLVTSFLDYAISYGGVELLDFIVGREATYTIYVMIVVVPLLIASDRSLRVFGALVGIVLAATYLFFSFAYVSVFCFGGAVMSLYLTLMIWTKRRREPVKEASSQPGH